MGLPLGPAGAAQGLPVGILTVQLDPAWPTPQLTYAVTDIDVADELQEVLPFAVDTRTRVLLVAGEIDYEQRQGYSLRIEVTATYAAGTAHV